MLKGRFLNQFGIIYVTLLSSWYFFTYSSLYLSLSLFVYCVSVWASTYPTSAKRILILQKKSSRIASKKSFDENICDYWSSMTYICFKFEILFIFKANHVYCLTPILSNCRAYSLTWPESMQIYGNKRNFTLKKRVQLQQELFETPTWPPFHYFERPIWPPWRPVNTLFLSLFGIRLQGPNVSIH